MAEPRVEGIRLTKCVYRGRCSTIYRARNFRTGDICAVKHVDRHMDRSDKFFRHIRNEYRVGRAMLEEVGEEALNDIAMRSCERTREKRPELMSEVIAELASL